MVYVINYNITICMCKIQHNNSYVYFSMGKKNKSNKGKTPSNNERKNKPEVKKKQNSKQDITGTKIEPQSAQAVEAIENADVSNQPSESVSKKEMEIAERGKNIVPITKDLNESTSISNTFAPGKMENTDELDSTMNTVKMDSQSSIDKASKTVESGKSYRSNEYTSDSCRKMKMLNTGKNLQFNEVSKKSKLNQNKKSDYKSDDSKNHPKESRNEGTASSAENVKNECESEESNLDNWENKNFAEEDLESTACKVNNPKRKDDSWDDKDDNWHVGTSKTNNSPKNEFNYKNWEQNKYGMENDADQFNSKKFRNRSNDKSTEHSRSSYRKSSRSRERADKYYDQFKEKYMRKDGSMDFKVVVEEFGDLFVAGKEYSLGHCVAEDMNMGSGIAVTFRWVFLYQQ